MMGNVNCLRCRFRHEDNGNCTAVGGFCTAVTAAHCPLLREYLDTWLTPEEIKAPFTEDAMINLAAQALGVDIGRLNELAEADKDVTAAQLYFYQWQAAFNQLTQAISHIKDEDKAGKLCAAIRAQLAAWGKAMEGTT